MNLKGKSKPPYFRVTKNNSIYFKLLFSLVILFLGADQLLFAQTPTLPKREFRGVWIATVNNIDYPEAPSLDPIAHKERWRVLMEEVKSIGLNTVIVQIRPTADAFFDSEHAPWSAYLTGKQGTPLATEIDLLDYMIEIAHENGLEFHAWLNPYRATFNMDTTALSPKHVYYQHPDWLLPYGNRYYFNPGLSEVREHLKAVVGEVVNNYEVDAIHFDDYFYPYKISGLEFPDSLEYEQYGRDFLNISDWRRNNVDEMIAMVADTIRAVNPNVKFGISPFGVWRNQDRDRRRGSKTRAGITTYDDLYADVLKWIQKGWIDYVIPQLYWNIGYDPAAHDVLVDWWQRFSYGRNLYIGHALYKVGTNKPEEWLNPSEIPNQIELNRASRYVNGSAFFSAKILMDNPLGVTDSIRLAYQIPALLPELPYMNLAEMMPPKFKPIRNKKGTIRLKWKVHNWDKDNPPVYYIIYRLDGEFGGSLEDPRNILDVVYTQKDKRKYFYHDETAEEGAIYTYVVTAVNGQHTESNLSKERIILKRRHTVKRVR